MRSIFAELLGSQEVGSILFRMAPQPAQEIRSVRLCYRMVSVPSRHRTALNLDLAGTNRLDCSSPGHRLDRRLFPSRAFAPVAAGRRAQRRSRARDEGIERVASAHLQ